MSEDVQESRADTNSELPASLVDRWRRRYENTSQSDTEALQLAIEEGRTTLQQQVQFINEIYKDTIRAFQIYFSLIGILFTANQLNTDGGNIPDITSLPVIGGIILFVLSIMISTFLYHSTNPLLGIGSDGINEVREGDYSNQEFLSTLAISYEDWIEANDEKNELLALLNFSVLILLILSFVLISYTFIE